MIDAVDIILCRTEGSANIGAACRAMKTMGLSRLHLVQPSPLDITEIKKWSVKAFDIFEHAIFHESLTDAIKPYSWVVSTSRRHGKNRKNSYLLPHEFARRAVDYAPSQVALVFGNEKNGLNDAEMQLCQSVVTIETSTEFASINLAQAVQICCYVLRQAMHHDQRTQRQSMITQSELQQLVQNIGDNMANMGAFDKSQDWGYRRNYDTWYDILARAQLTKGDMHYLQHAFDKLRYGPTKGHNEDNEEK